MRMSSGKLTFTGKVGAGNSLTSQVLTPVTRMEFDFVGQVVNVYGPLPNNRELQLDLAGITTFTASVAGGVTSVTLS